MNGEPVSTRSQRVWPSQAITIGKATIELRAVTSPEGNASLPPAIEVIREYLPAEILRERRYQIVRPVARGDMGAILGAIDQTTGRSVAMKVMLEQNDGNDVERFIEEAKVTARLEHPNIVPVHELSVNEQDQVFYTMKFVRGVTLREVLQLLARADASSVEKYPVTTLLTVFQKICDALAFAHSRGVIHPDLKPENVMFGDYGEVLVMDWGTREISRLGRAGWGRTPRDAGGGGTAGYMTMPGAILGTPHYMAPEQARGEVDKLDARADIYSLGAILFHILALRPSVFAKTASEVVEMVGRGEIEPLASAAGQALLHLPNGRIPRSLAAVACKALALDPAERYQTDQPADGYRPMHGGVSHQRRKRGSVEAAHSPRPASSQSGYRRRRQPGPPHHPLRHFSDPALR